MLCAANRRDGFINKLAAVCEMRTVLLQDLLEIIFSLSLLITSHVKPQTVTHTHCCSYSAQSCVHLKDKDAPLRDSGDTV